MADEGGEVQEIEMEVEEQETEETTGQAKEKEDRGKAEMQRPPRPPSPPPPPSAHPSQPEEGEAKGVQIRPGYNPKMSRPPVPQAPPTQQFLISPITGEKIPADKMQEHMRYGETLVWVYCQVLTLFYSHNLGTQGVSVFCNGRGLTLFPRKPH